MRSVLSALVLHLKSDPTLTDVLDGGNIWDISQPSDDDTLPAITLLWHENAQQSASRGLRLGVLQVDIWDKEGSTVRAERIRDELEYLLDRKVITVGEKQWIRSFLDAEAQVPTEVNETLVHWTMDFSCRYWRQAWIERVLAS